ncbi:Ribosomal protein L32 [Spironucleus salmonicida]|uniref:Ribosomal protein L32 n=1 Tax=Spironucleus salmonicida TaxID=348837 RepID=V6LBG8_9EUKA|nr:Ribosomal protein L32 [Spironucleus salmonicida]|eukprot:EST41593.1 Ribosomal protein L32 [Spironucleus salmonicida]
MPALQHKTIVHKKTNKFGRFQSDQFKRVGASWRKPRGLDSVMRRQMLGNRPMVSIGYGSDKATRFMLSNGYYPVRVCSMRDLESLRMNNNICAAVFASTVGAKKRQVLVQKCQEMGIHIMNGKAKTTTEAQ